MGDAEDRGRSEAGRPRAVGEVLLSEFLWTEKRYAEVLAEQTGLPLSTAGAILEDEVAIDDDIAARLAVAFMTDVRFWIDLQTAVTRYDCTADDDAGPPGAPADFDPELSLEYRADEGARESRVVFQDDAFVGARVANLEIAEVSKLA